jgi:hypothetical protein
MLEKSTASDFRVEEMNTEAAFWNTGKDLPDYTSSHTGTQYSKITLRTVKYKLWILDYLVVL